MGKKNKAEKKGKNGKKKDELLAEPHDLASILVQAARSMRTVMSRNLLESGLYAGQDGVMLALAEMDGLTAGGACGQARRQGADDDTHHRPNGSARFPRTPP